MRAASNGMSDFYSVLKQSIIDRGLSTTQSREEAYGQARRAMINRLWSYDPPLAEDEIDHRIGQFDTAVAQIELDVVEAFAAMDYSAPGDDGERYYPTFGGREATPGDDDGNDDDLSEFRASRQAPRSLEERSLAVERALNEIDQASSDAAAREPAADHAELSGWSGAETAAGDDPFRDFAAHAPPGAAPTADHPPQRTAPPKTKPKPATGGGRASPAGAAAPKPRVEAANRSWRLYSLIGIVAILGIVFLGGLAWLFLPGLIPSTPVVLQTDVPGGVSDPDTAIRLPRESIAVTNSFSLFDGRDPTVFAGDPDNPVRFDGEYARISTSASSPGAKVIIGPGLSSRLAGRAVRVTIDARAARENGATSMRFAYESGVALSHWQTANLASDFTELGLVWRVPALRTSPTGDYIIIEPGIPGSGTAVEIRSVRIDMVDG